MEQDESFYLPIQGPPGLLAKIYKPLSQNSINVFTGEKPTFVPTTEELRKYILRNIWGSYQASDSFLLWTISADGTPISADAIQLDHIIEWDKIKEDLMRSYSGKRAKGTPFYRICPFPDMKGQLIKGLDYIDDPEMVDIWGEDVQLKFTNEGARKYYNAINNLRPLSGSLNSKRNNLKKEDQDLGIIPFEKLTKDFISDVSIAPTLIESFIRNIVKQYAEYDEDLKKLYHEKVNSRIKELEKILRDMHYHL